MSGTLKPDFRYIYWSAAADLADPDSAGWAEIGIGAGTPGRVEWLDPHTWGLDVGLMLRR